ncbi:MerR family transcriptional regulator [Granulicoccus sp. GXG6511]|uniref:MerR family transcriptional regulator n=1 Tax=Granulicoccus sp. GXG6511 TaxID=3381351 RepID=UPI003D7C6142
MDSSTAARYTVKQVAALTGVLETTLRVWERRYGVVDPQRSPGGYRLYDDAQVERLRRMAALVAAGVPASVAARTVGTTPASPDPSSGQESGRAAELDRLDLVRAAAALDPALLDGVLTDALAAAPFERVADEWLLPELARLGDAWAARELGVAHEHFTSAAIARSLGAAFADSPAPDTGPVLVGLPERAHHELGLLAFATCLRRQQVEVVYLGADVPVADWVAAAVTLRPRGAVVGAPLSTRVPRAQDVVDQLHGLAPPIAVWVGGGLAGRVRRAVQLPEGVAEAATAVATSLRAGATP